MTKFWELEEIPSAPLISGDDQRAELIFSQTVKRTSTGRFMVSLPLKESEPDVGNTYPQALRRFLLLESRLIKNPELYNSYSDFINEYIHHEYMTLIPFNLPKPNISCYLPHHCVLKPDSISTKLRVVWDASAKGPKGLSLNDILLPGPKLQNDLSSLLLIFRLYPIVFIADIRRMFLQILITPEHRKFQRILWRFSTKGPIREYELNTVTFGVSSSPFLAIRTLNELAEREKENFPNASRILKQNTYIDDVLGFSPSISSALDLQRELIDLLKSGGFQLAKWASNCSELLAAVPESDRQMSLSFDKEQPNFIKVLGLQWHPKSDIFTYQYKPHESECTKRTILQVIGRIFDPLGLLCPILLLAKYIMQQLWLLKIDWDDTPPEPLVKLWTELKSELPLLSEFKLPRQISLANRSCDIIAICDASNKGYAAVVYFRVEGGNQISVSLVCARSRVAPISNRQTLARLELLGAVLLSNLGHRNRACNACGRHPKGAPKKRIFGKNSSFQCRNSRREGQCSEAVAASPVPALEPSTSTSTFSENAESVEPTYSTIEAISEDETEALTEMGPEMTSTILLSEDPGMWPRTINNEKVRRLVEREPPLIRRNCQFSTNQDKRTFLSTYFVRKLKNGFP
ncbi:uncharacterized protein LOC126745949 [Anthonomus grandis grandis]|uniref:uncharacterized protein LOC126745949 n=1 Tax=Anthonomus grandis grandis TaxID=2921223 RepID=UPI002165CEBF|nr:uncharacterized protein LOC126745949 [Anthonomus grandis grandis]